jgi:peptide/nickel transport system substrate-binding protein
VAVALTACAGGNGSDDTERRATDSKIDVLQVGTARPPTSTDLAKNYDSAWLLAAVTEPLESSNMDGTFTPMLAESVEQPDPRTLVYTLRQGATFSNGNAVAPADVVWSLNHLRDPSAQTAGELDTVESVKATGHNEVTVTFATDNPAQRGELAFVGLIQEKANAEKLGDDDLGTPGSPVIGTGPYMVDSFSSTELTLTSNPEYWGEAPASQQVEVLAVADDNAAQLAIRSGEIDVYNLDDPKLAGQWDSVPGVQVHSSPSMFVDYVTMDTTKPPFDDIHVRRAIAHALQIDGLITSVYGDAATPVQGMSPPEVVGLVEPADGAFDQFMSSQPQYKFDLDKARDELAQSAYPDGFDATFSFAPGPGKLIGVSLAENLEEIGVTLHLDPKTGNQYYGDFYAGKFPSIGHSSIGAVTPDPGGWYGYFVDPENPYNSARFSTPKAVAGLEQVVSADADARWDGVQEVVAELNEQLPYVCVAQPDFVLTLGDGFTMANEPDYFIFYSGRWLSDLKSTL